MSQWEGLLRPSRDPNEKPILINENFPFLVCGRGKFQYFNSKPRHKNWDMNIKNSLVDVVFISPRAFCRSLWATNANKTFNIQIFIVEILTEVRVNEQRPREYATWKWKCFLTHKSTHPLEKITEAPGNKKKPFLNENSLNQWVTSAQLLRIFRVTRVLEVIKYSTEKNLAGRFLRKWIHYHNFIQTDTLFLCFPHSTLLPLGQLRKAVKVIKAHHFNCCFSHVKRVKGFPTQIFIVHVVFLS